MPSTATITAFYTFASGGRARATQFNTNFSSFRGHYLSIDPFTQTATDLTYNIGSEEHYWRSAYIKDIDLETSTSTATLLISGNTTNTTGSFQFKIEGTEKFNINSNGYLGINATPSSVTNTAAIGQFAVSSIITVNSPTTVVTLIPNSTLTISTVGRPIEFGLMAPSLINSAASSNCIIYSASGTSGVSESIGLELLICPNTVATSYIIQKIATPPSILGFGYPHEDDVAHHPLGVFSGILNLPAGTYTLCLSYRAYRFGSIAPDPILTLSFTGRFYAYEV